MGERRAKKEDWDTMLASLQAAFAAAGLPLPVKLAGSVVAMIRRNWTNDGKLEPEYEQEKALRLVEDAIEPLAAAHLDHIDDLEQLKQGQDQIVALVLRVLREVEDSVGKRNEVVLFEGPGRAPAKSGACFRGRDNELAELERLLLDNRTVCVVATGIGGIGKTTLAEEFVATRAPEQFPDGVAWLDGRELTTELGRIARRFGWTSEREPSPAEAGSLLGQELHTQPFLLVVDNFDPTIGDPDHLPSPGGQCRTLITSRSRSLAGRLIAASLELGVWNLEVCREHLRERCSRLQSAADMELDRLAEFVGRLPLGVRLLVSVLDNRRSLGAAALLELLAQRSLGVLDKYEADRGIAATFQLSYEALSDTERRVLQALAVCAKQTRVEVVTAVARLDASEVLDELQARGLVEFAEGGSATPWSLHDVVRMFVAEQQGREEFESTHEDFVLKYVAEHAAPGAHSEFSNGVADAWVAFQRLVARDPARSIILYRPLEHHLTLSGRFPEAIMLSELLCQAAPESDLATIAMNSIGGCYRTLGDIPQAIQWHTQALDISKRIGRRVGEAAALHSLGNCYLAVGQISSAMKHYKRAYAIQVQIADVEGQSASLGALGECQRILGHVPQAIKLQESALAISRTRGDLLGQSRALSGLGNCRWILGETSKAIDFHEQALSLENESDDLSGQAGSIGNLGVCYQQSGDISRAIKLHQQSFAIHKQLNDLSGQFTALNNLSACHVVMGNYRVGMRLITQALDISRTLGRVADQATLLSNLGVCLGALGNISKSSEAFQLALALEEHLGRLEGQAHQLYNLGCLAARHGKSAPARSHFTEALDRYRRMGLSADHPDVQRTANALAGLQGER